MGKRNFTAEFKAHLVLEVLREERELVEIAAEHEINPNQLRAWKKVFLEKAPMLFSESRQAKEAERQKREAAEEKSAMLKTIGQLTLERDFLQKQALKERDQSFFRPVRK